MAQDRVPTTDVDKEELFRAGLGEREIEFESLDMTQEEFKELIVASFPCMIDKGWWVSTSEMCTK